MHCVHTYVTETRLKGGMEGGGQVKLDYRGEGEPGYGGWGVGILPCNPSKRNHACMCDCQYDDDDEHQTVSTDMYS